MIYAMRPARRELLVSALAFASVAVAPAAGAAQPPELGDDQSQATSWLVRRNLLDDPASPVIGHADADTTIVEFFDYHCPYASAIDLAVHVMAVLAVIAVARSTVSLQSPPGDALRKGLPE